MTAYHRSPRIFETFQFTGRKRIFWRHQKQIN